MIGLGSDCMWYLRKSELESSWENAREMLFRRRAGGANQGLAHEANVKKFLDLYFAQLSTLSPNTQEINDL